MNTLVDVSKLGSISVVKKLNSLLNKVLGLRLFYRLDLEAGKNILENKEALKKLFGSSSNMLAKDLKKPLVIESLSLVRFQAIVKELFCPLWLEKRSMGLRLQMNLALRNLLHPMRR